MMKVLVNGELKELDYSRNGADCTNDFVEAAQYQYDDESGAYIMDSDTFDFWEEAIETRKKFEAIPEITENDVQRIREELRKSRKTF